LERAGAFTPRQAVDAERLITAEAWASAVKAFDEIGEQKWDCPNGIPIETIPGQETADAPWNSWSFFDWANILQEANARLREAELHHETGERATLEYWTAHCAHANAVAAMMASEGKRSPTETLPGNLASSVPE
jgi:hypothetical protein